MTALLRASATFLFLFPVPTHAAISTLGGVNIVVGQPCAQNGDTVFNDSVTHIIVCAGGVWTAWSSGGSVTYPQDISGATDRVVFNDGGSTTYLSFKGNYNVLIGEEAGIANTGYSNAFIGYKAGQSNTSGYENFAMGAFALQGNTTGTRNVAIGNNALLTATAGNRNVAIGDGAMYHSPGGNSNISIGRYAGDSISGDGNISIGENTNYINTGGSYNVMIGQSAGDHNAGNENVFIGIAAGSLNSTGMDNTVIGPYAGQGGGGGDYTVMIGYRAGHKNTQNDNVFIGDQAGTSNTTGSANTFIGPYAGDTVTTGSYNTLVGTGAGGTITTGGDNTVIGESAGNNITTGTRNAILGVDTYASNGTGYSVLIGYGAGNSGAGNRNILIGSTVNGTQADYAINIGNVIYGTTGTSDSQADTRGDNSASLRVDGSLQLGTSAETCNASNGGRMRYNSSTKKMQYCNETAWTDM